MKIVAKIAGWSVVVVACSFVYVFSMIGAGTLQEEKRGEIIHTPVDCAKKRPQVRVHSSSDGKFYDVDVCAVADSSEGEDFRSEVK
jgi:hypothetical protein